MPKKKKVPTLEDRRAVVLEPEEKKKLAFVQQLYTIKNEKAEKLKQKAREKAKLKAKLKTNEDQLKQQKDRKRKKGFFKKVGILKQKQEARASKRQKTEE